MAVDVSHAQVAQLGQAQACAVGQHEEGARLGVPGCGHQASDLLAREDLGQALRGRGQRDLEDAAITLKHLDVEKPEGAAVLVDGGAREFALVEQVQQIGLNLMGVERIGAASVVLSQAGHRLDVGFLSSGCHAAQLHRAQHALTKWSHGRHLQSRPGTCPWGSRSAHLAACASRPSRAILVALNHRVSGLVQRLVNRHRKPKAGGYQ